MHLIDQNEGKSIMKLFVSMYQIDIVALQPYDLQDKFLLVRHGIDQAMHHYKCYLKSHPDAKMLFLMPENSFCAKGDLTYFDLAAKQRILDFLTEISAEFPESLFILGSLRYFEPIDACVDSNSVKNAYERYGLWYFQTLQKADREPFVSPSKYQSAIESRSDNAADKYCKNVALVAQHGKVTTIDKKVPFQPFRTVTEQTECVFGFGQSVNTFECWGFKFGLEICMDNDLYLLRRKLGEKTLDVHVLISASIPNLLDTIACHEQGLFVHCDAIPDKNSILIQFDEGQGQEIKPKQCIQESGLILWDIDVVQNEAPTPLTDDQLASVVMLKRTKRVGLK